MSRRRAGPAGVALSVGLLILSAASAASAAATTRPLSSAVVRTVFPGFTVLAEGPLTAQQFASYAPDPTAAAAALGRLARNPSFTTYQRTWSSASNDDEVIDLVVALPAPAAGTAYLAGQRASLARTPGVRVAPVPGVPGGVRYTYLSAVPTDGVEQVVTFATGRAVATISCTSSAGTAGTTPFTSAEATALSVRQYRLLHRSSYGGPSPTKRDAMGDGGATVVGWVLLGLATAALVGLLMLVQGRRRRRRGQAGGRPGTAGDDGCRSTGPDHGGTVDHGEGRAVPCLRWEPR